VDPAGVYEKICDLVKSDMLPSVSEALSTLALQLLTIDMGWNLVKPVSVIVE
jgi:hypothetical protein